MEGLGLVACFYLYSVEGRQHFVVDGTPAVVFNPLVPSLVLILFYLVDFDVNCCFLHVFFHLLVVTRSKGVDVNNRTVNENLVVDQRWEVDASKSEANVALGRWVQKVSFSSVDCLEKSEGVTLASEVNQVLVVTVDAHISEGAPGALDLLSRHLVLSLQFDFFLAIEEATPGPLNLDSGDMVHRESVVLE